MKKILLSLGATATAIVPIGSVIACGEASSGNNNNSNNEIKDVDLDNVVKDVSTPWKSFKLTEKDIAFNIENSEEYGVLEGLDLYTSVHGTAVNEGKVKELKITKKDLVNWIDEGSNGLDPFSTIAKEIKTLIDSSGNKRHGMIIRQEVEDTTFNTDAEITGEFSVSIYEKSAITSNMSKVIKSLKEDYEFDQEWIKHNHGTYLYGMDHEFGTDIVTTPTMMDIMNPTPEQQYGVAVHFNPSTSFLLSEIGIVMPSSKFGDRANYDHFGSWTAYVAKTTSIYDSSYTVLPETLEFAKKFINDEYSTELKQVQYVRDAKTQAFKLRIVVVTMDSEGIVDDSETIYIENPYIETWNDSTVVEEEYKYLIQYYLNFVVFYDFFEVGKNSASVLNSMPGIKNLIMDLSAKSILQGKASDITITDEFTDAFYEYLKTNLPDINLSYANLVDAKLMVDNNMFAPDGIAILGAKGYSALSGVQTLMDYFKKYMLSKVEDGTYELLEIEDYAAHRDVVEEKISMADQKFKLGLFFGKHNVDFDDASTIEELEELKVSTLKEIYKPTAELQAKLDAFKVEFEAASDEANKSEEDIIGRTFDVYSDKAAKLIQFISTNWQDLYVEDYPDEMSFATVFAGTHTDSFTTLADLSAMEVRKQPLLRGEDGVTFADAHTASKVAYALNLSGQNPDVTYGLFGEAELQASIYHGVLEPLGLI